MKASDTVKVQLNDGKVVQFKLSPERGIIYNIIKPKKQKGQKVISFQDIFEFAEGQRFLL